MSEQELIARVDRLERRSRRLTVAAGALALAFLAAITTAAVQEQEPRGDGTLEVVRARLFELVDGDGQVCARLYREAQVGAAALTLRDAEGRDRVELSGGMPTPRIVGDGVVALHGSPGLLIRDDEGRIRAMLGEDSFVLHDTGEKNRVRLGLVRGRPVLLLQDERQRTRAALGAYSLFSSTTGFYAPRPEGSIALYDQEGELQVLLPE